MTFSLNPEDKLKRKSLLVNLTFYIFLYFEVILGHLSLKVIFPWCLCTFSFFFFFWGHIKHRVSWGGWVGLVVQVIMKSLQIESRLSWAVTIIFEIYKTNKMTRKFKVSWLRAKISYDCQPLNVAPRENYSIFCIL